MSRLRLAFLNTRSNDAASVSRLLPRSRLSGDSPDFASASLIVCVVVFWCLSIGSFWRRVRGLRRKLCPAFGATALQHKTARFGCHSCAESVGASPLQNAGLECAFHCLVPELSEVSHPRLKEGRQGYAGMQLVSIEQAVNSRISRRLRFSGGTGVDVLDCLPAVGFDGGPA